MKPRAMLAILVGLLFGGLLLVLRPIDRGSPAPSPSGSTPGMTPEVDPVGWGGVAWQRVPNPFPPDDPHPLRIDGLTVGNGIVVGWGRVATPGRNQFNDMGAVFVSTDGLRWRAIPIDDGVGAADGSELSGVGIGPLGMLAYGGVCCEAEELAMWRSPDGLRWTRSQLQGEMNRQAGSVARIAGTATGWVAVGGQGQGPAIWASDDGAAWNPVHPVGAGLDKGGVSDVAATARGLVAVGTVDDAAGTHDGAIWISGDGTSWTRVAVGDPSLTGPDETELSRIVSFAGGLFVIGNFGSHEERVRCEQLTDAKLASLANSPPQTALSCGWGREHHWISPDASSWRRLPPFDPPPGQPPPPGARPVEYRLLAAGGPGLVDLAEDAIPPDGDVRVWISADGIGWQPLNAPSILPAGTLHSAFAVIGRRIVVIGDANAGQEVTVVMGAVP